MRLPNGTGVATPDPCSVSLVAWHEERELSGQGHRHCDAEEQHKCVPRLPGKLVESSRFSLWPLVLPLSHSFLSHTFHSQVSSLAHAHAGDTHSTQLCELRSARTREFWERVRSSVKGPALCFTARREGSVHLMFNRPVAGDRLPYRNPRAATRGSSSKPLPPHCTASPPLAIPIA